MILGIAADLSAPPSAPMSFREVTMVAKAYKHHDVLAYAERDMLPHYAKWFKRYGLFDYVDELISRDEITEFHIEIEGGRYGKLTAHNVHLVIALL
jgi:hypothetical protein